VKKLVTTARSITQPFINASEDVAQSLGMNPGSRENDIPSFISSPGLPRQHLIGSGPELSQQIVMIIRTGDLEPAPSMEVLSSMPPRYYWRSLNYDVYTGRGWLTSETEEYSYAANEPILAPIPTENKDLRLVKQEVETTQGSGKLLHFAGTLVSVNEAYNVNIRTPTPIEGTSDVFGVMIESTKYQADSIYPFQSDIRLRTLSNNNPDWINTRYLSLPDNIPERVHTLAEDLTSSYDTPYEKALAIESYLRSFPYTLDVQPPPLESDIVDYFLFDLQKGYCDYYASSMVVLARSAGLPARLVIGYASGYYDPINARYLVSEADAHSWVEIYFPEVGWVEFEPTAGRPSIERSLEEIPITHLPDFQPPQDLDNFYRINLPEMSMISWISIFILFSISIVILWMVTDIWRLKRLSPTTAISRIYNRLQRRGSKIALHLQPGDTPYEFATKLQNALSVKSEDNIFKRFFYKGIEDIDAITEIFTNANYSPRLPNSAIQIQAISSWRRLRWRLIISQLSKQISHKLSVFRYNNKSQPKN
jgi:transglutaminase-like putative cysteine protease